MNIQTYIEQCLIGKKCTHENKEYTIKKLIIEGAAYGGTRMSVKICDGVDTDVVPMTACQVERAMELSL